MISRRLVVIAVVCLTLIATAIVALVFISNTSDQQPSTTRANATTKPVTPVSTSDIDAHINDYANKTVTVQGRIVSTEGTNMYYVSSDTGDSKGAIGPLALDFSQIHIDPKPYTNFVPAHPEQSHTVPTYSKGSYTVTGKVVLRINFPYIVVKSIK